MAESYTCSSCGALLDPEDQFCGECGAPVAGAESASPPGAGPGLASGGPSAATSPPGPPPTIVQGRRTAALVITVLLAAVAGGLCCLGLFFAFFATDLQAGQAASQDVLVGSGMCCFSPGLLALVLALVLWAVRVRQR
jgi:hypothetical protein